MNVLTWLNQNGGAATAMVTAVYAFFTILLWMATRRQAALTRQIFEATHRPELAIRPYLAFAANPGFVRLDMELINHGSTAATVSGWQASIRQGAALIAKSGDFKGPLCVFPKGKQKCLPLEAKGQVAAGIWNGVPEVYLEATVDYRGSSPLVAYSTRLRGRLVIAGQEEFRLEQEEHEVI